MVRRTDCSRSDPRSQPGEPLLFTWIGWNHPPISLPFCLDERLPRPNMQQRRNREFSRLTLDDPFCLCRKSSANETDDAPLRHQEENFSAGGHADGTVVEKIGGGRAGESLNFAGIAADCPPCGSRSCRDFSVHECWHVNAKKRWPVNGISESPPTLVRLFVS